MQARRREEIVAGLTASGLVFRTFSIAHDSPHAVADWDWNQRDLPHIPFVHGGFRLVPLVVGDELAAGMFVQRIFGVALPLGVTYHHPGPGVRVYTTTLGPLALVVEATLTASGAGTQVSTTYSVGARPLLRWMLPAAEWFLRRNYQQIFAEDEPLRARRRQLRGWGYRFDDDAGYQRSLRLDEDHVRVPAADVAEVVAPVGDTPVLIGRDDHLGLRIVPAGDALLVFPRMCPHQGASLDDCADDGETITCPWHGRRIACVARFGRHHDGEQVRELGRRRLSLRGGVLRVAPPRAQGD